MAGQKTVKPDPSLWLPLLDEYRLSALPHDTVLRGTLRADLHAASPEVVEALELWPAAAYLQTRGEGTELVLVYQIKEEVAKWPLAHVALLLLTLLTTMGSGALMMDLDPFRTRVLDLGRLELPYPSAIDLRTLWVGAPFALPFLGVLLAHEMGHYLAARTHRVRVSLPYFIPFPPYFSVIGTMGAFIRLKGPMVRRSILFDIGAAGPLASFVLALPLFVFGLDLSTTIPVREAPVAPFLVRFAGQSVWLGGSAVTQALAALSSSGAIGETVILLHPLALVGWLGLFVTALNLLPLGQLDGGHILYALDPRRHVWIARGFLVALFPLGFLWWGWWAWAVVVLALHRGRVAHPDVIQEERSIGRGRRVLGWALIAIFFLTFVTVPIRL